jgi:hypothetical protein
MAGPDSPVVDPTELVEIITIGVVKVVDWREDDGSGGGSGEIYILENRWGCYQGVRVSESCGAEGRKGLTVSINSRLPENFVEDVTALIIKEIGVHAQLIQSVAGARICAE